jgi:hypothetical protein
MSCSNGCTFNDVHPAAHVELNPRLVSNVFHVESHPGWLAHTVLVLIDPVNPTCHCLIAHVAEYELYNDSVAADTVAPATGWVKNW